MEGMVPPSTIWLTGLSGSGKTTIAEELQVRLKALGQSSYILDGDLLRNGISLDLGYSMEDRNEQSRRAAHLAAILNDAGVFVIVALISPLEEQRELAKEIIDHFVLIHVATPLEVCIKRDTKGLYAANTDMMTGIGSPYEEPKDPDLVLQTNVSPKELAEQVIGGLTLNYTI